MDPTDTDLIGTWFISGLGVVPDEDGIIVFRADGICIQFPCSVSRPLLSQTFRLWYSFPDANTLKFKMKPDEKGWLRSIERTDTGWTMIYDGELGHQEYPCRLARPDELQDWFEEMMEKNLIKMAALAGQESIEGPSKE